jgi:hypothetical protein
LIFTRLELRDIVLALSMAADVYRKDARFAAGEGNEPLSIQMLRRSEEMQRLATDVCVLLLQDGTLLELQAGAA